MSEWDQLLYSQTLQKDILNVKFTHLSFYPRDYKIYELAGRLVKEGKINELTQIKIHELSKGNYLIMFFDEKSSFSEQFKID